MNLNKNLHWLVCIIFLLSCARQSSPTGGPKDTIPPVLVKAIPQDEKINYKGNDLVLLFSENIILNTPKEQLIVTPSIGKDYKIIARKNSVIITFDTELEDSTTYTFNFRESIQDITEKNPARNLQLAFSTGDYIDSLSIEGTIFDLIKGTEIKEATVALHTENDTFDILKHPAVYFTKTDDKGKFKISHLKPDNYFVYAFDDKNRNLVADSRTESYGFISEYLYLLENLKNISVGLLRLDARPLKLTSTRPYNTYFNIRTTKNLRTFELTADDSSDLSSSFGEDQSNIRLYKTKEQDSLKIRLIAMDSIDNRIDTTLYAKFLTREVKPETFDFKISSSSILAEKGQIDATLIFTKPLKEINFDSLFYKIDSLKKINFTKNDVIWDPLVKEFMISKKVDKSLFLQEKTKPEPSDTLKETLQKKGGNKRKNTIVNEFYAGKGAFISIEKDSSKKVTQIIKPQKEEELSIINVEIKTEEKAFFVELLDNTYKVISRIKNKRKVRFEDVTPGQYQLRLIIDKNGNGRWDAGNYFKKIEPEKIIYYRAPDGTNYIKGVKANWDVGGGELFITY